MRVDVLDGAELARPDDLVLVEQEDRHPGGGDQLVDLGPPGPQRGPACTG